MESVFGNIVNIKKKDGSNENEEKWLTKSNLRLPGVKHKPLLFLKLRLFDL